MVRRGKYTRTVSPVKRARWQARHKLAWWRRASVWRRIGIIALPIIAFLIAVPVLTYIYFARDIANSDRLMNRNNTGVVILASDGSELFRSGRSKHREILPLDKISDATEKALVSSEDKNFYTHGGFSIGNTLAALYSNFLSGEHKYGGSTLTQQLAKNTLLSTDKNYLRKYQELSIAIAIERTYSKDEILSMYLNSVYFGENAFGIEDAARIYFGVGADQLSLAQSAMLIGVLPAPSAYSPISGNPNYARKQQTSVLTKMVNNGAISEEEKQAALAEQLVYQPARSPIDDSIAPHFIQMVIGQLYDKYGEETVTRSGYQVTTTLDPAQQNNLNYSVRSRMSYINLNGGSNASAVAIDPKSGEIKALVGSADWKNPDWGEVNMVTTPRQPGSSFKPIYYSEALAQGVITPATVFRDEPTDFGGYSPQNASRTYSGDISVRNALARSLNIPSVKVMQKLGIGTSVDAAKRMGISTLKGSSHYGLSLALGSAEVPLLEMATAYAGFANGGQQFPAISIKKIDSKFGKMVFTARQTSKQSISPEGAFLISSILSDQNARAPVFGGSLTVPGRTAAVKTGTTDDSRDAWTIGYTTDLVVGVWVGNNDNRQMYNGGSMMAGPIWTNMMRTALAGRQNAGFSVPVGIVQRPVCRSNGLLATSQWSGTYVEYLLASRLPGTCAAAPPPPPPPPPVKEEEKPTEEEAPEPEPTEEDPDAEGEETPPEEEPVPEPEEDPVTPPSSPWDWFNP